ncbi:MAG: T9SS type A sorting domain-containing protein [Bacteroidetes bacterium]|nr:T9SS type A sorting domain-containing protein [Bacteroidota bacterium]
MRKLYPIHYWLLLLLAIFLNERMIAQTLTNQTSLSVLSGGSLTVQGDLSNESTGLITLEGDLNLDGNITNTSSASLTSGAGTVNLNGTSQQTIGGTTQSRFGNLNLDNAAGLQLGQSIKVEGNLSMTNGNLDLNGQDIDLSSTGSIVGETDANRIFGATGKIMATRDLNAPAGGNIAGLGVALTSSANLGSTVIERAHNVLIMGTDSSIARNYNIQPTTNSGLAATLRIDYFNSELNNQDPNNLNQWRQLSGSTTWDVGNVANKSTPNFIEGGPYNEMGLWTLSSGGELINSIDSYLPRLSVNYYPNPLSGEEQLKVEGLEAGEYTLVLSDMRGRKVWKTTSKVLVQSEIQEYSLPRLPEGIYSLQIHSENFAPTTGLIQIQSN